MANFNAMRRQKFLGQKEFLKAKRGFEYSIELSYEALSSVKQRRRAPILVTDGQSHLKAFSCCCSITQRATPSRN